MINRSPRVSFPSRFLVGLQYLPGFLKQIRVSNFDSDRLLNVPSIQPLFRFTEIIFVRTTSQERGEIEEGETMFDERARSIVHRIN